MTIPDLWHATVKIKDGHLLTTDDAEQILETWTLCHDLLKHLKRVCVEPKTE